MNSLPPRPPRRSDELYPSVNKNQLHFAEVVRALSEWPADP